MNYILLHLYILLVAQIIRFIHGSYTLNFMLLLLKLLSQLLPILILPLVILFQLQFQLLQHPLLPQDY